MWVEQAGGVRRVVVLDYGSGNLRSAERALRRAGAQVEVTADVDAALTADGLVVPGVGAFAACMAGLLAVRGDRLIGRRLAGGRPVLGICVGMQVLFSRGVEHGVETEGCDQWPGTGHLANDWRVDCERPRNRIRQTVPRDQSPRRTPALAVFW